MLASCGVLRISVRVSASTFARPQLPVWRGQQLRSNSTFRALVCDKIQTSAVFTKDSFPIKTLHSLEPKKGEVVISVKAAAANFPDVLIVQGKYQFQPEGEFSPGSEVAGVVSKIGDGVKNVKVGDEVIGVNPWGGFAEEMIVPSRNLVPKPSGMPFPEASGISDSRPGPIAVETVNPEAFLMVYGTSYYALADLGNLQPGQTLLVLGAAGGVGLAAVELGKALGAKVIAAASDEAKLKECRDKGADATINYRNQDLKTALKEAAPEGLDVVLDPVGGPMAETCLRNTAWGGRYLVIGFAAGEIPKIPLNLPLLKGCSIVGVFWGPMIAKEPKRFFGHLSSLVSLYRDGKIKPLVSSTFPLDGAWEALNMLSQRKVVGKAVIVPKSA